MVKLIHNVLKKERCKHKMREERMPRKGFMTDKCCRVERSEERRTGTRGPRAQRSEGRKRNREREERERPVTPHSVTSLLPHSLPSCSVTLAVPWWVFGAALCHYPLSPKTLHAILQRPIAAFMMKDRMDGSLWCPLVPLITYIFYPVK